MGLSQVLVQPKDTFSINGLWIELEGRIF